MGDYLEQIKYIIHACKKRADYVYNYLYPSLLQQGIKANEIFIWMDNDERGNLNSFLDCAAWICFNQNLDQGIWHLQDDVIISKDFKQKTEEYNQGIVCGFCSKNFNPRVDETTGQVPAVSMWYSFQCIRIPNRLIKEFLDWYYKETIPKHIHDNWRLANKFDDSFFHDFMENKHPQDEKIINLKPNLVDHIDYLIGGTIINQERNPGEYRSYYWQEPEKIQELEEKINGRQNR